MDLNHVTIKPQGVKSNMEPCDTLAATNLIEMDKYATFHSAYMSIK